MQKLELEEVQNMHGGISFWTGIGIIGLGIFLVGVFDGFTRPIRCN